MAPEWAELASRLGARQRKDKQEDRASFLWVTDVGDCTSNYAEYVVAGIDESQQSSQQIDIDENAYSVLRACGGRPPQIPASPSPMPQQTPFPFHKSSAFIFSPRVGLSCPPGSFTRSRHRFSSCVCSEERKAEPPASRRHVLGLGREALIPPPYGGNIVIFCRVALLLLGTGGHGLRFPGSCVGCTVGLEAPALPSGSRQRQRPTSPAI